MWLVDTNLLIAYSREEKAAIQWFERRIDDCRLSVVVVAEFLQGVKNTRERAALDWYCQAMPVLPVTQEVALCAGQWGLDFMRSHRLDLTDLLIAATAQVHGLQLATHNLKHYPMFEDLKPPY
jgi:predicted nucleic acid-binding protein